jgi:hypothetical protein
MALWARFFPLCSRCFLFIPPSFCAPWSTPVLGACILFVKYRARTHVPTYTVVHASFRASALSASPCGIADISCMLARHILVRSACALALPYPLKPRMCSLHRSAYAPLAQPRLPTPRCTRTLAYTLACTVNLHPYFSALLHRAWAHARTPVPFAPPTCPSASPCTLVPPISIQAVHPQRCRPLAASCSPRPRAARPHRAPSHAPPGLRARAAYSPVCPTRLSLSQSHLHCAAPRGSTANHTRSGVVDECGTLARSGSTRASPAYTPASYPHTRTPLSSVPP